MVGIGLGMAIMPRPAGPDMARPPLDRVVGLVPGICLVSRALHRLTSFNIYLKWLFFYM